MMIEVIFTAVALFGVFGATYMEIKRDQVQPRTEIHEHHNPHEHYDENGKPYPWDFFQETR
jgi:hypothetical protein